MKNFSMKRFTASLLFIVMIVAALPASLFSFTISAEDTVLDAAIFCSDVHGSTSDLTSVLEGVKTSGVTYSSIGFVGDTCLTVSTTESTVNSALGYTPTVMFSYAASHDDEDGTTIKESWDWSGEVEGVSDYYLVYTIRETDMQYSDDATTAAAEFTTWYNALTNAEKALPIFVMSHRPLHARRGANLGAEIWTKALNAAGATSDIVVFWAHNHTSENSIDTNAYYVAKGSELYVETANGSSGSNGSSSSTGATYTIAFTYMNAGYINANNQSPARLGVATTVKITANSLIFQDYNSSGEYTGTYAHNVTVERNKTATSIEVSGTTRYTIDGNGLALTVTATYDDGTTGDVTASSTFTGYDLTTSGKYTVTATYGELTDTIDITVAAYGECLYETTGAFDAAVEVVSTGVTAVTVTNVHGEPDLSESFTDYASYNVALTGYTSGNEIEYTMSIIEDMDLTNFVLYHVATVDGATVLTPVEFTVENDCIVFTTNLTGTFAYGSIIVPDGYTLYSISASDYTTEYFVGDSLDLTDPFTVTATYKKDGSDDFLRVISVYEENNNPDGYTVEMDSFDMTKADDYDVKLSYTYDGVTVTTTFPITVWNKEFTSSDLDVTVTVGSYGVYSATIADVSAKDNVTAAVGTLLNSGYNAYDITLGTAEGYDLSGTHTVKVPAPENADVVYYLDETTGALTEMEDATFADGYATFTTDHFSVYIVGDTAEANENSVTISTGSSGGYIYTLDTDGMNTGDSYIIVAGSVAYLLNISTGSASAVSFTFNEDGTITLDTRAYDVTINSSNVIGNGTYYLGEQNKGTINITESSSATTNGAGTKAFTVTSNGDGTYTMSCDAGGSTCYLSGSSSSFALTTSSTTVRLYKYTGEAASDVTYTVTGTDFEHIYTTATDDTETSTIEKNTNATGGTWSYAVVSDANGIIATGTDTDGNTTYNISDDGVITFSGNTGTAYVRIYYTWTADDGNEYTIWDTIEVKATEPYYTVDITHNADGTATSTDDYTSVEDTIVIKGEEAIAAGYDLWVKVYLNGVTEAEFDITNLTWKSSDESIVMVDSEGNVTFPGGEGTAQVTVYYKYINASGNEVQVIDVVTFSVSKSLYVVPGDGTDDFPTYPNEGAVRFDKTATAVGNYSETGIAKVELSMTGVPYTTGSAIDVLLMIDMSTSMDTSVGTDDDGNSVDRVAVTITAAKAFAKTIVQNEDGTYNSNKIAIKYFNGSTVYTTTDYISVSSDTELEALYTLIEGLYTPTSTGTYYSVAMKDAYDTIIAQDAVSDNTQALVFMSDGGPTYYTYLNDSGTGTTTSDQNGTTFVGWFDVDDNDTSDVETDDTATPNSSFKTEYYSYLLKKVGYPVYTVGLGLSTNDTGPSSYTGLTSGAHEAITSYILSSMATSASYFYNVADSDAVANMGNIFAGIAASIKEAATDVVVKDKVGSNYSLNFSLPGYRTDNALDPNALDGLTEFYIQVVDYVLDATTHERTGVYTVLENFTFNLDGTLKSHTVDGVACGDTCTHVTFDSYGVVTAIDGTYFDYKSDDTGEYLTWTAEKITSTELAFQYFAHLDNSSGVAEEDQVPAGTYYTNEYATLTYTNYNGNQVQQEFPVPQLTWYGAQVSYVFYLVNDAGQPVNKAGRVVPFAEAVYVTDVYTYSVIWNDLEQSAGLEAKYLADDKVPDIYELYDDDAFYNIHVYADEEGVNLNNHFVIGGDVTDDYNTVTNSWTNAKTTYVFNTKSDGTKYNIVGAYIANDGSDSTTTTSYLCKGEGTVSGVAWSVVTLTDDSDLVNGVYYYDVNGVKTRALTYDEGTTYYQLTAASYTVANGETQVLASSLTSTTGGTVINGYVYYVDENGAVYTIVQKTDGTEVREGFDFANTTVAFAVVWSVSLVEDVVVIDYGLDVVIDVITNDTMAAGVSGVMTTAPSAEINTGTYDDTINNKSLSSDLWEVTIENLNAIRFKQTAMGISGAITFYYEANVNYYTYDNNVATLHEEYMYSSVTIIPATSIYYEESFVSFENGYVVSYDSNGTATFPEKNEANQIKDGADYGAWSDVGTAVNATQAQDRPGDTNLPDIDANNVYGYDSIYSSYTEYSLGAAKKVTVHQTEAGDDGSYQTTGYNGYAPKATFTFTGTGFDVISLTDSDAGMILVTVTKDGDSSYKKTTLVANYYGMSYEVLKNEDGTNQTDEDGNLVYGWVSTENGAIWQVPVIKMDSDDLGGYGTYTVEIQLVYMPIFDLDNSGAGDNQYDFILDAIRIYDPAGTTFEEGSVIGDAYIADGEAYPHYLLVKDAILAAADVEKDTLAEKGVVFIDGKASTTSVADYTNPGPNNEAYLAPGQSISFKLTANTTPVDVQLGAKLAYGSSVDVQISVGGAEKTTLTITTATDMYYSIMEYLGDDWMITDTITIANTSSTDSSNVLSLTNIKATFASATTISGSDGLTDNSATTSTGTYSLMSARMMTLDTTDTTTEEPVSIAFLVDAEVIEDACAVMTALYAPEPEVFVPEVLEYIVTPGFFGYNSITVITSKDVASLTVNGIEAQKLNSSRMSGMMLKMILGVEGYGINLSANDYYVWTVFAKRADSYEIVAVNADGLASDPSATDSSTSITKDDITSFVDRSEIFKIMEELANQTFNPEYFETHINERFDGKREIITQTSEDVEYVIIDGKIVDRYITKTVIDTETGEKTVTRVWITDAEDEAEEEVEVNVYDEKGVGSESRNAERKSGFDFGSKNDNSENNNNNSNNGNSNSASKNNNSNDDKGNNGKGNSGKYGRM